MGTAENNTAKKFLAVHAHGPLRLMRNNVGSAWAGRLYRRHEVMVEGRKVQASVILGGEHIDFGLAEGSGDWVGWESVIVTADMVGARLARFLTVEVKTIAYPKRTDKQKNWSAQVVAAGGRSLVVREAHGEPGYTVQEMGTGGAVTKWEPEGLDLEGLAARRS